MHKCAYLFLSSSSSLPVIFLFTSCHLPLHFLSSSSSLPVIFLFTSCHLPLHFLFAGQFVEIPGTLRDSQLHVWPCAPKSTPRSLAWLTAAGVYYCTLKFSENQPGDSLLGGSVLIPYTVEVHADTAPVMGVSLSEFHCLLLYRDK